MYPYRDFSSRTTRKVPTMAEASRKIKTQHEKYKYEQENKAKNKLVNQLIRNLFKKKLFFPRVCERIF